MIHDQEKSDSPIVAVKSANKSAPAGAESMEPRGEAKGNTGRNRTCRTPSRESVSQGLNRVRQTAKERK
ncbi:group II intron reverse transcriptase/maturase, partial [Geomonas sp. Red69]|nr:group II intron reverse transcriptase/maturase [Geomonas diazotrophica]